MAKVPTNKVPFSEDVRKNEIKHLTTRIDWGELKRKSKKERDDLAAAQRVYPGKRHAPLSATIYVK